MSSLGIAVVWLWRHTFGLLTPAGHLQVPPELLAVRDRRASRPRAPARARSLRRGGILRCNPWSHGGVDYAESATLLRRRDGAPRGMSLLAFTNPLQPLEQLLQHVLIWLHENVGFSWGWSIVVLTVLVRILLVPITVRQIHSMQNLQAHAPEMKEIQKKWKHDKQRQNEELMAFYRENKINPAASCLPIVLQIPIFISLFYVLRNFDDKVLPIYGGSVDWLHLVDITQPVKDGWGPLLLVIYVASQLSSSYFMSTTMQGAQRVMLMVLPIVFVPFILNFPLRLDALLADDQPVDDGPGARDPQADAEAGPTGEAELPRAGEGRAGTVPERRRDGEARDAEDAGEQRAASPSPAPRGGSSANAAAAAPADERRDLRRGRGRDGG